jgi:hypothetical protein
MLPELPLWSCGHRHATRREAIECRDGPHAVVVTWEPRFLGSGWVCYRGQAPNGPSQLLIEPDRDGRLEQGEAQAREQMARLARRA